jgi:hypothetical protein
MKRILMATVIALAGTTASFAETGSNGLSQALRLEVSRLAPNADLNNLSAKQVSMIEELFADSENVKSGSNPNGAIGVILGLY